MNAFTSRDLEAADRLALARLDDDGAPPAVSRSRTAGSHEHDAIRRDGIEPVAARQEGTAAIASGEVAEATSALLGAS
jgi:hypothetical protein